MADAPIPCTTDEATMLRELVEAHQRAERDLVVAFTMFAKGHALPDGCTLVGVTADAVNVQRPSSGLPHG